MVLTYDNVEIIYLQIVKMEIGGFGEKLRSLEEMKKLENCCFCFCICSGRIGS